MITELYRPFFVSLDAIHGGHFEVHFENVRVPVSNIILGKTLQICLVVFQSYISSMAPLRSLLQTVKLYDRNHSHAVGY